MNVVVSAIVDPWVTTLSFVVALAMKIQVSKIQNLCTFQARFSGSLFRLAFQAKFKARPSSLFHGA